MRHSLWIAMALIVAASPARPAELEGQTRKSRFLSDRFQAELGGYSTDLKTDVAVGSGSVPGTLIRLEEDLGVEDDDSTLWLSARYRFNRKSSIQFAWIRLDRGGGAAIDEEIDFEGLRFTAIASSRFDQDLLGIVYGYSFFNNGKLEAGIQAGISGYRFRLALAGTADLLDANGDPLGSVEFREEDETLLVPVPVVGISLAYAIRENVIFRWGSLGVDLDVSDVEGHLIQNRSTLDWYFHPNFGIGGGLQSSFIDVKALKSSTPFTVDYRYSGFLFYVTGAF